MLRNEQFRRDCPSGIMFPSRFCQYKRGGKSRSTVQMLGEATAVLVTLATGVAAQLRC